MTCHLRLVTILVLTLAPLAAAEEMLWVSDRENAIPMMVPDANAALDAGDAGALEEYERIAAKPEQSAFEEELPSFEEELQSGDDVSTDACAQGFYPVCGCGCSIRCLDHWCCYDVPCRTTDGWTCNPCQFPQGHCYLTDDCGWVSNDVWCDVWGPPVYQSNAALRIGGWAVSSRGSPTKVGEYQDLESSPFWDVDAFSSDGVHTWDVELAELDNETNDARLHYYGPRGSADVHYQRFLRRLDHDPLTGFDLNGPIPPTTDDNVVSEDLNVGQDYAIRIHELDAKFKGRLADNLKWRLNLWAQRKFGERQTNATAHCFDLDTPAGTNNTCHILSQGQTIDWVTVEVEPVIEAEFENVTVQYSRTMRSFSQSDGIVDRQYTHFSGFTSANNILGPDYDYALVPDNFTQIDKLRIDTQLNDCNQVYASLFNGNTKNEFRDTHRKFGGFDLRLMNSAYDGVRWTAFASMVDENNELPPFYLTEPPLAPDNTYDEDSLKHPVDYTRTRAGIRGSWRPGCDGCAYGPSYGLRDGTSLRGGYEYYLLDRSFATYETANGTFTQLNTRRHQIEIGPSTRWSHSLDSYARYKVQFIKNPLIGVSEYSEDDPDIQAAFNTSQPEQVHWVELGGTWTPTSNFLATAQISLINSWNDSQYAHFSEDNYPIVFTVWYAPTCRLSLTGGYAYYSNWIDQDITLGAYRGEPDESETTQWDYAGQNNQINLNANYAWTECVQLVAGYEWNHGSNVFAVPPSPAGADWSLLPSLSDVIVETNRITAGMDWQPYCNVNFYARYIYFDYDDISSGLDSGFTHMFLAGTTVNW